MLRVYACSPTTQFRALENVTLSCGLPNLAVAHDADGQTEKELSFATRGSPTLCNTLLENGE